MPATTPRVNLKAIATRSWGLTRIHLNAAASLGPDRSAPPVDPEPDWAVSLAVDRTLYRQSLIFAGEVAALRAVAGAPIEVTAALGVRYQLTPTLVLDLGMSRRLRARIGPSPKLTLGLSHAFAVRTLMPSGRR